MTNGEGRAAFSRSEILVKFGHEKINHFDLSLYIFNGPSCIVLRLGIV
jgi:hypothetical protein